MIKDNIEIVTKPNKGRSVIAKYDILAGQNIINELPIVCIPYLHSTISGLSVTSGAFKYSDAEKELKMATVATKFDGSLCMLAARYFIHSLKDHDTDRYNMIRNHVDISILNTDNSVMESLKECAKIMLQLIKRSCRGVANVSLELCIDIIYKLSCNVFTIVNEFFNDCGLGVYPLAAMINHSCIPNCIQHFNDEGVIAIRTMRNIKAGEEISISYIDIAMPTWLRRKELLKSYYFHCNCDRCIIADVTNDMMNEGYQCSVCSLNNLNGIYHLISSDLQLNIYKMWISGDNKLANNCSMSLFNKKLPYDLPLPYFNLLCSQITTATTTDYNNDKEHQSDSTSIVEEEGDDVDDVIRFQCNLCKHIYNSKQICETIRKSLHEIEMSMNKSNKKSNDYLSNEIIRFHSIYNSLKHLVPSENSYCMLLIRKRLKLAFEISLPIEDGVLLFPSNISNKYNIVNNGMDIQRLYEINLKKLMKAMAVCYPGGINICSLFCTIQYIWYIASKYNLYNDSYSLGVYSNKCSNSSDVAIINDRKTDLHTLFHLLPNILDQISIIYSKTHPFYYSMTDSYIAIKALF